ncbi:hypothetical protein ACFOLC_16115 [Lysobacter cavernae]|uniref:Uncharacterized protein n=1 Tax=Lysobacter cavernae TaxID=1685901 RepID=A0ABV7RV94_9GAMM
MNAKEFVASWKEQRDDYLASLFAGSGLAGKQLMELGLSDTQTEQIWRLMDTVTTDTMYSLLLGLDGSAAIGNSEQQAFKIYDEDGNLVSDCGDLETEAYECFHGTPASIPVLQERSLALLRQSRKDWNIQGVPTVSVGDDGIVRCHHCGKSFHIGSAHSWDGQRHRSCGAYLHLSVSSSGA